MNEKWFGLEDQEFLKNSIDEVIEDVFLDHTEKAGEPESIVADRIEWPIEIYVHIKTPLTDSEIQGIAESCIDSFIDCYDSQYGNPDGDPFEATETIKDAAYAFAKACAKDYEKWQCESTGEVIKYTREMFDKDIRL